MGPNRQPKTAKESGSLQNRRNGAGGQPPNSFQQRRRNFFGGGERRRRNPGSEVGISSGSRDMIIDVLRHIATGGASDVAESHFDPKNSRNVITFKRNVQMSPTDMLQLFFEKNGFPPDIVSQYIADIQDTPSMFTGFANMMELERDHMSGLREAMWDLFAMMVWNHELLADEAPPSSTGDDGDDSGTADEREEWRQLRQDERDMIEGIFGEDGILLPDSHPDAEMTYQFLEDDEECICIRLHTSDNVTVVVTVKLLATYPRDPPLIQVTSSSQALSPSTIREVYDAAVDSIAAMKGMQCLTGLISACREHLANRTALDKDAMEAKAKKEDAERREKLEASKSKDRKRREFVDALADLSRPKPEEAPPAAETGKRGRKDASPVEIRSLMYRLDPMHPQRRLPSVYTLRR